MNGCWGLVLAVPYGVMCRDVPWNVSTDGPPQHYETFHGTSLQFTMYRYEYGKILYFCAFKFSEYDFNRNPHRFFTLF